MKIRVRRLQLLIIQSLILASCGKDPARLSNAFEPVSKNNPAVIPHLYFGGTGSDTLTPIGGSSIMMTGGGASVSPAPTPSPLATSPGGSILTNTGGSSITM